ncbi:MAG: phosphodiester glycosidase family protein, partial [Anaerolineae bacterium]
DVTSATLAGFAAFLAASDLGLVQAVNLDGGSSTGLRYRAAVNDPAAGYDSFFVPCAVVIR